MTPNKSKQHFIFWRFQWGESFISSISRKKSQVWLSLASFNYSVALSQSHSPVARNALISRLRSCAFPWNKFSTVQSLSLFNSLWPHGLQHIRLPSPSSTPRVYSNSCPLSRWCHTMSSSVTPFSSWPQSFPASGSFPVSQLFASGGQSTGASVSASVLPMNIQGWGPLGLTGFWLLAAQEALKSLLQHHSSKASVLWRSAFFMVQLSYPYMTTGKIIALYEPRFYGFR